MTISRREFIGYSAAGSAALSVGTSLPQFLLHAAETSKLNRNERVVVFVQMSGGNDGLNTIVPYKNDDYRQHRKTLGIPAADVLKINNDLGFHPSLSGFSSLLEDDKLAIVQGVGYPDPNRSHFESMDIWHSCRRKHERREDGWLGRYLDVQQEKSGTEIPALHFGHEKQPFALTSTNHRVPSVRTLEQFRLKVQKNDSAEAIKSALTQERSSNDDLLGFVQSSTQTAINVSERFQKTGLSKMGNATYPESDLGKKLQTVAQLIRGGLPTRIYYVAIDGFDTHANQPEVHANLLQSVSDSVTAFTNEMKLLGESDRVLTVCFSEFGRRVAENASDGTDHGTAAPMILAGGKVKPGIIGEHPRLDDLENGDLKHHTDFRQVYAAILENWLKCPSETILDKKYTPVDVIS